jgi:hypothetical protein
MCPKGNKKKRGSITKSKHHSAKLLSIQIGSNLFMFFRQVETMSQACRKKNLKTQGNTLIFLPGKVGSV